MLSRYTKHHQTYINNLNFALSKYPDIQKNDITFLLKNVSLIPEDIRQTVRARNDA
ncbi:hypothetical protein FEF22_001920 [Texas Phoenix palm phytoplasma]|uniref:superoxide dismutase n=1 Tax=Texas Phoenix palm phytoplasma TaxID=176709 RepID=A0ABS5BIW8_9MOLU|nr:hypothetical protein [Texas Phoenix palm phytoplasma]MBP3059530.1 hypothetical protein [Texas Phoenix palm phytoplasma]